MAVHFAPTICHIGGIVWVLTNANGLDAAPSEWVQVALPAGSGPSPRHSFAAGYDSQTNRLVLYGGCTDVSFVCLNESLELWELTAANGTGGSGWMQVSASGGQSMAAHAQFAPSAAERFLAPHSDR
jgi:hypothetical protein